MSEYVSNTKALDCAYCGGVTTHYQYHDGESYCLNCGAVYEEDTDE